MRPVLSLITASALLPCAMSAAGLEQLLDMKPLRTPVSVSPMVRNPFAPAVASDKAVVEAQANETTLKAEVGKAIASRVSGIIPSKGLTRGVAVIGDGVFFVGDELYLRDEEGKAVSVYPNSRVRLLDVYENELIVSVSSDRGQITVQVPVNMLASPKNPRRTE